MPRNYKRKTLDPLYNQHDLEMAVLDIEEGMSWRAAERKHGISRSVISRFINGGPARIVAGRRTALGKDVEDQLEKCIVARASMGYPIIKSELIGLVNEFILANNINSPFVDGKPGDDWYSGFMKRHPRLSLKNPEMLQKVRVNARDSFVIYEFYDQLEKLYMECGIDGRCSPLLFNADESGFGTDPSRIRAIGVKGVHLNRVADGSGRESTTVIACISASGDALPPLIVFKGQAVQPRWISDQEYPGTMYAATKAGWMEESTFFMWLTEMFIQHVEAKRTKLGLEEQSAILFFDGHSSHISYRIVKLGIDHNIKLVKFPSHMTDKIQPLDICVFGPVKTGWTRLLVEHGKGKMGQGPCHVSKSEFSGMIGKLWECISKKNCERGFSSSGLFPLSTDVVKDDWLIHGSFDGPLDLSIHCRPIIEESQPGCSRDIGEVFSKAITRAVASQPKAKSKGTGYRLRHHTMGEVLTANDVMARLKEAEEKKGVKRAANCGRANKRQKK